jgi:hypothetical protein
VEDGVEVRDRQRLVALIPRCQDPNFLDMGEIGRSSDGSGRTGNKSKDIKDRKIIWFFDCLILPTTPLAVYNHTASSSKLQLCP